MVAIRYAAILCASAAFIPAAAMAQQTQQGQQGQQMGQQQTAQNECVRLEALILEHERTGREIAIVDIDQVRTWREEQNRQACRDALRRVQTASTGQQQMGQQTRQQQGQQQEGAQIFVEQPPANVQIQQGQPEIMVHQPAPQVTVRIPPPQITVRMPQPQAQVSQPPPQVSVRQPQPTVEVQETEQRAQVQVEEGQPQVRYEMEEAQVQVQREGEPVIRVEDMEQRGGEWQQGQRQDQQLQQRDQQAQRQDEQSQQRDQQAQRQDEQSEQRDQQTFQQDQRQQDQFAARQDQQVGEDEQLQQRGDVGPIRVSELKEMDVYNAQGEQIGSVEQVIVDTRGDQFVVVSHGGFLGLGDKKIALPLDNLSRQDDRLVIRGLDDEQIERMPAWEGDVQGIREVEDEQEVTLK